MTAVCERFDSEVWSKIELDDEQEEVPGPSKRQRVANVGNDKRKPLTSDFL
jgi:hypothetical protein